MNAFFDWIQDHIGQEQAITLGDFYTKLAEYKAPTHFPRSCALDDGDYDFFTCHVLREDDEFKDCYVFTHDETALHEVSELAAKLKLPNEVKCWFQLEEPVGCLENFYFELWIEGSKEFYEIQFF